MCWRASGLGKTRFETGDPVGKFSTALLERVPIHRRQAADLQVSHGVGLDLGEPVPISE